jgi:ATPase subunit of ABC transporter with duplicated ATPase domains
LLPNAESTNHPDIDSIEAIEAGFRAYDGALLIVSHDEAFLAAIGISRRVDFRKSHTRGSRRCGLVTLAM